MLQRIDRRTLLGKQQYDRKIYYGNEDFEEATETVWRME